jgi:uncharacterized protein YjiS (DUF1127 family)
MASVTLTHTSSATAQAVHAAALVAKVVAVPFVWMKRIRQRRELMGLLSQPEHLIKDVGLQRGDITREALKPFWMP